MQTEVNKSCPSSVAQVGAILLGVINDNGSVGYLETPVEIDEDFLTTAGENAALERRFRFSSKCVKSGCEQWHDGKCGVIERMIDLNPDWHEHNPSLPSCSIRPTCRWYSQEGAKACSHCPHVVTNSLSPVSLV